MADDLEVKRTRHGAKHIRIVAPEPRGGTRATSVPEPTVIDQGPSEPEPVDEPVERERVEAPAEAGPESDAEDAPGPGSAHVVETSESVRERLARYRAKRAAERDPPEPEAIAVDLVEDDLEEPAHPGDEPTPALEANVQDQTEETTDSVELHVEAEREPTEPARAPAQERLTASRGRPPTDDEPAPGTERGLLSRLRRSKGTPEIERQTRAFTVLAYGTDVEALRPGTSPLRAQGPAPAKREAPTSEATDEPEPAAPEDPVAADAALEPPTPPVPVETDVRDEPPEEPGPTDEVGTGEEQGSGGRKRRLFGLLPAKGKDGPEAAAEEAAIADEEPHAAERDQQEARERPKRGLLSRIGLRSSPKRAAVEVRPPDALAAPVPTPPVVHETTPTPEALVSEAATPAVEDAPDVVQPSIEEPAGASPAPVEEPAADADDGGKGRLRGLFSRRDKPSKKKAKREARPKKAKKGKRSPRVVDPLAADALAAPVPAPPVAETVMLDPADLVAPPALAPEPEPEPAPAPVVAEPGPQPQPEPAVSELEVARPAEPEPEPPEAEEPEAPAPRPEPVAATRPSYDELIARVERTLEEHREEPPELVLARRS